MDFVARLTPAVITMEACAAAHILGRALEKAGHQGCQVKQRIITPNHARTDPSALQTWGSETCLDRGDASLNIFKDEGVLFLPERLSGQGRMKLLTLEVAPTT